MASKTLLTLWAETARIINRAALRAKQINKLF